MSANNPAFFEDLQDRRLRTLTAGLLRQSPERRGLSLGKTLRHAVRSGLRVFDTADVDAASKEVQGSLIASYYARRVAVGLAVAGRHSEAEILQSRFVQMGRKDLPLQWSELWKRACDTLSARWVEERRAWIVRGAVCAAVRGSENAGEDIDIIVDCSTAELKRFVRTGQLPWRLNYYGNHKVFLGGDKGTTADIWAFGSSRYSTANSVEGVLNGFAFDVEAAGFQINGSRLDCAGIGHEAIRRGKVELQQVYASSASARDLAYAAVKGWYFLMRYDFAPGERLIGLWAHTPSLAAEHFPIVFRMLSELHAGSDFRGTDRVRFYSRRKWLRPFFDRLPQVRLSQANVAVEWSRASPRGFELKAW